METVTRSKDLSSRHGFFSRRGGISQGVYASLNCGPGSGDDPALVAENRRMVAAEVSGRRDTPLLSCYQIHSDQAVTVDQDFGADRPKADALVTKTPGLILGVLTADCVPILFEDPAARVIGAAHAGSRGALDGIVGACVDAMVALGASPNGIRAAIGPAIRQNSYEVAGDFKKAFTDADTGFERFFRAGKDATHFQFNLPGFVESRLEAAGVDTIWNCEIDTYTSNDHFSYRRSTHRGDSDYGRQISAIMLSPSGTEKHF